MHKVLIVEDEAALAKVLKEQLEREGYKTAIAKDGVEAIKAIKKMEPDIILLDIILPKKSGFAVLEELQEIENLSGIPVIVLSNLDQDEDIKRAFSLGAVDYYVKSQHPIKEIVEKVEKYIIQPKIKR